MLKLIRVVLPLLTTFSALAPSLALAKTEVRFARDGSLEEPFLQGLSSAKRRIDLVVPDLSDARLKAKLVELAAQGRRIRVLTTAQQDAGQLEGNGIQVRTIRNEVFDFYATLDGPKDRKDDGEAGTVLVFSTKRLQARGDASLMKFTRAGEFVLAYQAEFNKLWANAEDYGDVAPGKDKPLRLSSAAVHFGSANTDPEEKGALGSYLAGAIDQAYFSVDVIARDLHRLEVYEALNRAAERGVQVRVLLEGREFQGEAMPGSCREPKDGSADLDECLAKHEMVDLRYLYTPFSDGRQARIQTNYVLIDGKAVITGNFGWARLDEFLKPSHLVTLRSKKVVKTFATQFDRSFAAGREPFRRLAATGGLCGRLKTVSVKIQNMRSLRQYVSSCE